MPAEIDVLRVWVLVTGLAGLSTAIGCYTKPLSAHQTLYGRSPHTVHPEFSRMFGTWLLTSTCVRVAFFLNPTNSALFWVTFCTYWVALLHFATEIFVYRTAPLLPGGIAPCVVASGSILWFLAHSAGAFPK
jgi:hypothetical protein